METNQPASSIGSGWYVPLGDSASTNCTVAVIPYTLPMSRVDHAIEFASTRYRPLLCRLGDSPVDSTPPDG